MIIKSTLTQKEFFAANLAIRYSNPGAWIGLGLAVLFFLAAVFLMVFYPEGYSSAYFITPVIIAGLPLVSVYFRSRSFYKSSSRLQEPMLYDFGEDNLTIKGDSFTTTMTWEKLYKVKQTKNWIFIYTNRFVANPLSKKDLFESDIQKLKDILSQHNVKNNL